jgi:DNA repair protein RadA/Sms
MTKDRTVHRCSECGATSAKWTGRCGDCGAWGSLVEERGAPVHPPGEEIRPLALADVDIATSDALPTGVDEVDRVLGGGLVPGSVTLLGGEPGVGKSTLLLQVLLAIAGRGYRTLLISVEESAAQVRVRAGRLAEVPPDLLVLPDGSLPVAIEALRRERPLVTVVDSIQMMTDPEIGSSPGSVAQVRGCAVALTAAAKELGVAVILVGHVTKDGSLAGPRVLEHVVDTVLTFEGDRHHDLRLLRAVKHRFGPTGELGLFAMADSGMCGVDDPSALFLGDRRPGACGSAVVTAVEGRRPLLIEVQALVGTHESQVPFRSAQGIEGGRLPQLLAVLQQAGAGVGTREVFVSAVGGVRVGEPAVDLGVALAIVSAFRGWPVPADVVAIGEIGLGREVRQVPHLVARLVEAQRLGFTRALVPRSTPPGPDGLELIRVDTVDAAIAWAETASAGSSRQEVVRLAVSS